MCRVTARCAELVDSAEVLQLKVQCACHNLVFVTQLAFRFYKVPSAVHTVFSCNNLHVPAFFCCVCMSRVTIWWFDMSEEHCVCGTRYVG